MGACGDGVFRTIYRCLCEGLARVLMLMGEDKLLMTKPLSRT